MSIKEQIGEVVGSLINGVAINIDIYDCQIEDIDVDVIAEIDRDGDLRVKGSLTVDKLREMFSDSDILELFTEEEIRDYLGE